MRHFFLLSLILYSGSIHAQQSVTPDRYITNFSTFKPHVITLPAPQQSENMAFGINNVTVLDFRFDTTLGFINKDKPVKKRLALKDGVPSATTQHISKLLGKAIDIHHSDYELVGILQRLWLSDDILLRPNKKNDKGHIKSGIIISIGYFLKFDHSYFPLYKFDSVFIGSNPVKIRGSEYIATALKASLEKMKLVKVQQVIQSTNKLNITELKSKFESRFELPVLSEAPRKGVYMTFEEFTSNRPSTTEFTLQSDNKTDDLYCKDASENEVLIRNAYAISDGKDFYIWSSENFYRLYPSGKTFNLFGAKGYFPSKSFHGSDLSLQLALGVIGVPSVIANRVEFAKKRRYYQLDMETGIFY